MEGEGRRQHVRNNGPGLLRSLKEILSFVLQSTQFARTSRTHLDVFFTSGDTGVTTTQIKMEDVSRALEGSLVVLPSLHPHATALPVTVTKIVGPHLEVPLHGLRVKVPSVSVLVHP